MMAASPRMRNALTLFSSTDCVLCHRVRLVLAQSGTLEGAEFDQAVRDITAFLEYAGEPAVLKRHSMGVWVILFLAAFTFLAWLLKKEYWKDVH